MTQSRLRGKKTVSEIDSMERRELTLTEEDRQDFDRGIGLFNDG
jgi:hypothetical protein